MADPVNAVTNAETGSRWYIHPITGERFISVTTVLDQVAKFGIPGWAAKLAATAAFDRAPWLALVATEGIEACNADGDDACGQCRACAVFWLADRHNVARKHAADVGSRLHEAAEQHAVFGPGGSVDADIQPYLDWYVRWMDVWKPEFVATEATVLSRKYGYAGTLDKIIQLNHPDLLPPAFKALAGLNLVGDTKTVNYLDVTKGWQVIAYSKAETILLDDGTEIPMPEIGGGLIVRVKPDRLQVRKVEITEQNFAYFIHLLRVTEGLSAGLNTVLSRPYTLKEK